MFIHCILEYVILLTEVLYKMSCGGYLCKLLSLSLYLEVSECTGRSSNYRFSQLHVNNATKNVCFKSSFLGGLSDLTM